MAGMQISTQIIVVNGTKKRVLLADTNEPMNVGMEQNSAIQVIDADAVYLITQSNRTFEMTAGHGWMHKAPVYARLKNGDGVVSSLLPMD